MYCVVAVLLLMLGWASDAANSDVFITRHECKDDQMCIYKYSSTQEDFKNEVKVNLSVSTTMVQSCDAEGEYGEQDATRYCLTFKDTQISLLNENQDESGSGDGESPDETVDRLLSGWFCFVQTGDGKVVAVYHSKEELLDIINFKKGVAAAFQSNFRQTEEEIEDDPQSKHKSHYTYETRGGSKIFHRTVGNNDIIEYPFHVPQEDVKVTKDEYLTYTAGRLQQSRGDMHVEIKGDKEDTRMPSTDDDQETFDESFESDLLSMSASYSLDIQYCYTVPRALARRRREVRDSMDQGYTQSGLAAHYNQTSVDHHQMKLLREEIPPIRRALFLLHHNLTDSKLVYRLQKLLVLEARYGVVFPEYTPALDSVLEYLDKISTSSQPEDMNMRLILYFLLAEEGSNESEKALLNALDQVTDLKERNTLITNIAFLPNASYTFVLELEKRIQSQSLKLDLLLLAYGALATTASPDIQEHIVRFLHSHLTTSQDNTDTVHLIHSLGNTGCNHTVQILMIFLADIDEGVRLAAIKALRKHTMDTQVQAAFIRMLSQPDLTDDEFKALLQALMFVYQHSGYSHSDNADLHKSVVSKAVELGDPDTTQLAMAYLLIVNTPASQQHLESLYTQIPTSNITIRARRGSDWDSSSNSVYNLVASQSSRRSDVNTYIHHKAYIWCKEFGVGNINLKVVAGGFVGGNEDATRFKMCGRAIAQGYAFGYTKTFMDVEMLVLKDPDTLRVKFYAEIAGHVLTNYDRSFITSWDSNWPISSSRYTIFSRSYPVFIYVGYLTFSLKVFAQLDINANTRGSIGLYSNASAGLIPKVTLTAQASGSATHLELVRGGIRVSASISYQPELQLSIEACIPRRAIHSCLKAYEEWPANYVEIYAFYQTKEIDWCCKWGVCLPCGFRWGSEQCWDAVSKRWDLSRGYKRLIYVDCDEKIKDCP